MPVRVRYAPSPTGPLHLGGVRTALYNYLFAKKNGGSFIIRVEDTDQGRFVTGAEEYMIEALLWCGINYEEGPNAGGAYGPYRQSERKSIYRAYADQLLKAGFAYYAFDTAEELEAMRGRLKDSGSSSLQYDFSSRLSMKNSISLGEQEVRSLIESGAGYVIRFKIPENEEVSFTDLIRGEVSVNSSQLDDKVLFKSDGMPTYHLANVVDDYLMKITHVIRGEEWLPSAPLHILLYRFLGWENHKPEFAHLPLILKPDGKGKLSKRDGDRLGFPVFPLNWTDPVTGEKSLGFRERGFFPEAFTNMIALLGWAGTEGKEILTLEEIINEFSIDRIHKAGAKFDFEKAKWFNHEYMKRKDGADLLPFIEPILKEKKINASADFIVKVCEVAKQRSTFTSELWQNACFFFEAPDIFDESIVKNKWSSLARENLQRLRDDLEGLNDYEMSSVDRFLHEFLDTNHLKAGNILPLLRVMLIGTKDGPSVFEIISLLGEKESVSRINKAMAAFDQMLPLD